MNTLSDIGSLTSLILTIIVFSGFFRPNILYRFAESLLIGVSAGYFASIWFFSIIDPAFSSVRHGNLLLIIPLIAGLLLFIPADRERSYSKLILFPAAFIVIATIVLNIPIYFTAFLQDMIRTSVIPLVSFDESGNWQIDVTINAVISIICVVSVLWFLIARHKKNTLFRYAAGETGRFCILVAIGTAFGYTLLSRLILFMGKFDFIIKALGIGF